MTKEERDTVQVAVSLATFITWAAFCGWVVYQSIRDRREAAALRTRIAARLAANMSSTWNAEGQSHDGADRVSLGSAAEPG